MSTRAVNVPILPVELYSEITSQLLGYNADLANLALVSRMFAYLTKPWLYRDIVLSDNNPVQALLCLRTMRAHPSLGLWVRSLSFDSLPLLPASLAELYSDYFADATIICPEILVSLLEITPHLRSLHLSPLLEFDSESLMGDPDDPPYPEDISEILSVAVFHPIQRPRYPFSLSVFRTNLRHPFVFDFLNEQKNLKMFSGITFLENPGLAGEILSLPSSSLEDLSFFARLDAIRLAGASYVPLIPDLFSIVSKSHIDSSSSTTPTAVPRKRDVCLILNNSDWYSQDFDSLMSNLDATGMNVLNLVGFKDDLNMILPAMLPFKNGPYMLSVVVCSPGPPFTVHADGFNLSPITRPSKTFATTIHGYVPSLSTLQSHFEALTEDNWTIYEFLSTLTANDRPYKGWHVWMEPVHRTWRYKAISSDVDGDCLPSLFDRRFEDEQYLFKATNVKNIREYMARWDDNGVDFWKTLKLRF